MVLTLDGLIIELHEHFRASDAMNTSKNKETLQALYITERNSDFPPRFLKMRDSDV